jgi:hypothetical protein
VRPASATLPFSSQERFHYAYLHLGALGCPPPAHLPAAARRPASARYWLAVPGGFRAAVGDRRADRHPARPRRGPIGDLGSRRPADRRRIAHRRFPHGDRQALACGPGGLDQDQRGGPAGRVLSGLLLHRGVADLGAFGHLGHHRRRAGHRARRRTRDRAQGRPPRARRGRPGAGRPRFARGPARRIRRERGPGQRRPGGARGRRLCRDHADLFPAGARPGRPDRDRVRLHPRRRRPDPASSMHRRAELPAGPGGLRAAPRAGHRSDRRGLHAVLPRPADRRRQHRRPAEPA